jgi:AcrR family transcriptional regulator
MRVARRVKKAWLRNAAQSASRGAAGARTLRRGGRPVSWIRRHIFPKRELAGASVDEIASLAGVGMPTIYARFAGKRPMFAAVVNGNTDAGVAWLDDHPPAGGDAASARRLECETVDLIRLSRGEARRVPELSNIRQTSAPRLRP